ncbi:expressed unknown protein [Seminavis robusta]|uniref:Mutator-like transposase domain-containing protein n=1 Tax=Seminavis robusta TaxID=568900 RepID=A0A9N8EHV7_9STRA|nr:expressed unknown protein [Seminavis robusta]|eukprot:Sro1243_g255550.1 n/a (182) ;mRNA; r:2877-3422
MKVKKNPFLSNKGVLNDKPSAKSDNKRCIIEEKGMSELKERNTICSHCKKGRVKLTFRHCGVATIPRLSCNTCAVSDEGDVAKTSWQKMTAHEQLTDYELNFKFVQAFVGCGDGPTEASRFLTFCSVPNATTMKSNTFGSMEAAASSTIEEITREQLTANLLKEVELTMAEDNDFDFELWK